MARIFTYIVHKAGVADDSAAELAAAAKKIDAGASPIAVVTGWGPELDAVCESLRSSYSEIWKVANQAIAYPNAELIRQALVKVIPRDSIVLVPHSSLRNRFGAGSFDQAEFSICLRCRCHRRSGGNRAEAGSPGIRRAGQRARSLRSLLGCCAQYASRSFQAAGRRGPQRHGGRQVRRSRQR